MYQQDSIPVGCVPPACLPYMFWWSPLGVSTRVVSTHSQQVPCLERRGIVSTHPGVLTLPGYPPSGIYDSDTQPLERTWNQRYPPRVDRQTPVKTLPSRNFVGGRQSDAQNNTINWRIDHYLLRYHFLWRPQLLCVRYGRSLLEGQSLFCLFFFFFSEICKQFVVIQACKKINLPWHC